MFYIRAILIILVLWTPKSTIFAQAIDSTQAAIIIPKNKKAYPVPKRALLLSLVPGLGQAYNKKYWKLPIIYGGIGFAGYMIIKNKKEYKRFDKAYRYRYDGNDDTVDTEFPQYSNDAIYQIRKLYDKNIQVAWIWAGAVYALNLADAFVDAHLADFDVSDDLGLKIQPSTMDGLGIGFVGILEF